jgi:hypothetical protein
MLLAAIQIVLGVTAASRKQGERDDEGNPKHGLK